MMGIRAARAFLFSRIILEKKFLGDLLMDSLHVNNIEIISVSSQTLAYLETNFWGQIIKPLYTTSEFSLFLGEEH